MTEKPYFLGRITKCLHVERKFKAPVQPCDWGQLLYLSLPPWHAVARNFWGQISRIVSFVRNGRGGTSGPKPKQVRCLCSCPSWPHLPPQGFLSLPTPSRLWGSSDPLCAEQERKVMGVNWIGFSIRTVTGPVSNFGSITSVFFWK